MIFDIKTPSLGESITEVEIGQWLKKEGEAVATDEILVLIESDKATMELVAPAAGVLSKILKQKGDVASVGEIIAQVDSEGVAQPPAAEEKKAPAREGADKEPKIMPAAAKLMSELGLTPAQVQGSKPGGRILKEDVLKAAESVKQQSAADNAPPPAATPAPPSQPTPAVQPPAASGGSRQEEVVPMTRLRKTLADRLVQAQQNAALLTTFNEIDMSAVMALRKEHQEAFVARYKVKLGFMSFFVKAVVDGLRLTPQINAEIRGGDIVYRNYQDIGVAVGGGKGLVVPVLRNAERMSFAEIEIAIADFGARAKENKLKLEELQGGTFTISNGGIYGSLLSTPIVNPPQSGILGMHAIQERPVAVAGQVVIRPMMYVALTYDHRLVDGREAVTFLKRIKEVMELPARMLLEI